MHHRNGKFPLTPKGEFAASLFGYELLLAEMHGDGVMDDLNEIKLNILLSGLVYEPRKGDAPAKLRHELERLARGIEHYARLVYRKESKYRIYPYAKPPHFNLAQAVEAWTSGETFDKLFRLTSSDEGELVRHFRMIIQLLKDLMTAPHTSDRLRAAAHKARKLINRGVVDAERQLRA